MPSPHPSADAFAPVPGRDLPPASTRTAGGQRPCGSGPGAAVTGAADHLRSIAARMVELMQDVMSTATFCRESQRTSVLMSMDAQEGGAGPAQMETLAVSLNQGALRSLARLQRVGENAKLVLDELLKAHAHLSTCADWVVLQPGAAEDRGPLPRPEAAGSHAVGQEEPGRQALGASVSVQPSARRAMP
jgi:hypothetical protein